MRGGVSGRVCEPCTVEAMKFLRGELVDRAALTEALDIAETRECICTLEECKCERLDEMRKLVKAKLG